MPRQKVKDFEKSKVYGPKIHLPHGLKIPISQGCGHVKDDSMLDLPPAWKVETVPHVFMHPKNANYYKKSHGSAIMRRAVWQHMFGGIFRSMFGIYANSRYWNPERERAVQEILRDEYVKLKRKRYYGIYFFEVTKSATIAGKVWHHGQAPNLQKGMPKRFWIRKGGVLCVRINRMEGHSEGHVDIEFQPICIFPPKLGVTIISSPYKQLEWLLKDNRLRRLQDDGLIYKIRAQGTTKPLVEGSR